MKILLDECVTKKIKAHLKAFDVFTVIELGWGGVKNGKLLTLCEENGFEILLTIDKNLVYQQNLNKYKLSIAVLNTVSSKIEELIQFIPSLKEHIFEMKHHHVYVIDNDQQLLTW